LLVFSVRVGTKTRTGTAYFEYNFQEYQ